MRYKDDIETRLTGRHKKAMRLSGDVTDKVILNIGCSIGWYEKFATNNNCKLVVGIDTDEKAIIRAKESVKKANFMLCSALVLPFQDNYFDIVTIFDVIEHIENNTEVTCLKEIKRVLKSDGTLIISTPNNNFLAKILDPAWYLGHRHYSRAKLQKLLVKSGFGVDSIDYGGGFYELVSMDLLYFFKWVFRMEIPFKQWFDRKRDLEYLKDKGFVTLFIQAGK
jgi:ubiquinone/menaquinone biosynthesis C-methylase UbiE